MSSKERYFQQLSNHINIKTEQTSKCKTILFVVHKYSVFPGSTSVED